MEGYKKLLLATDFSPHSEAAGQRAMDVARRYDADLTVFHVVEIDAPQIVPDEWAPMMYSEGDETYWVFNAKKQMAEFAKRINVNETNQVVMTGMLSPKRDILRYAKENDIDLIIMGTHGKFGLDILMGSTASGVMHRSECDVLTVRI